MAQQTFEEIAAAVKQAESGGKRYKDDGKTLTTSAKGALGEMQVMPKTIRDPGFGVVPARDKSPDEIARVGRDYLQAMLGKYGDMDKALAAYNMGPGSTDKWIAAGAKLEKLPEETRTYIQRVKGFLEDKPVTAGVSRETSAPRKPLPPSLPPMAAAAPAAPVLNMKQQVASLGPGYQAALALSFLSDTDDKEDRDTEKEPGIAEQFMAQTASRPSALAQFADFKIRSPFPELQPPVRMAEGGQVDLPMYDPQGNRYVIGGDNRVKLPMYDPEGNQYGGGGGDPVTNPFSNLTQAQQAAYYAANPTMASITQLGQKGFGLTSLGMLQNALVPGFVSEQAQIAMGIDPAAYQGARESFRSSEIADMNAAAEAAAQAENNVAAGLAAAQDAQDAAQAAQDAANNAGASAAESAGPSGEGTDSGGDGYVKGGLVRRANGSPEAGEVADMQNAARKSSAYQELERYLQSRGEMPSIKISDYLPANGVFNSDNLNIGSGTVKISKDTIKEMRPSVLAHEMTHAADRQVRQQAIEQGMFGKSNQFTEAYEKLVGPEGRNRTEFVRRLNPEYERDNRLYRTSSQEIPAHGVGAFVEPTLQGPGPRHLDATAATEFQILLELAQRNVDKGPKGLSKIPAFLRKMGRYSKGGEVTQEEIDAASRPAFITPGSGRGRKEGNISKALASGEGYVEFAKGLTNIPQNLVGAPMDISNMIANAFGGGVEKPVGGSEYIKEALRKRGLGFTPSTDPTLAGFYAAGDLGSNLVNPAGATRAVVKGAGKTGEAAKMLAKDFQQYNQQLAVPGASYAVRNRGTPFMMGYERTAGPDGVFPAIDQAEKYIKYDVAVTGDPKLNDWLSNKLTAYLRRDFATPDDQFVKAADNNQLLHFVNKPMPKRPDLDPYYERINNSSYIGSLPYVRKAEGFEPQGVAKTEYGKRAETLTDASAWPVQLEDITSPGMIPRNMDRTDPSARLTELGASVDEMLQFDKLAGDMERMRNMPRTYSAYSQPGIKVPDEYLLTDEMLIGLTPAQASNRVARFRNWEEENRQRMASKALFEDPSLNRTRAEGGSVWVNPDDLAENPNMRKLVQDVGCDGGWCTKDESSALSYGSDENRLSILLDSKARPQAQLTITSREYGSDAFIEAMTDSEAAAFRARYPNIAVYNENAIMSTPEFQQFKAMNPATFEITEIKGTNNRTDFENAPYLKQIQQQIKNLDSQFNLQNVENLDKIGMVKITNDSGVKAIGDEMIRLNNGSQYVNKDDFEKLSRQAFTNMLTPPQQRAKGGMVERQSTDNRRYM